MEKRETEISYITMETPLGEMIAAEDGVGICCLDFIKTETDSEGSRDRSKPVWAEWKQQETPLLVMAKQQLLEYMAGKRKEFDLPLSLKGTEFQKKVWAALTEIPYGETRTYGQIAAVVGNPKAGRAVGMANHRNPVSIVVPCHRVIGAGGKLVGYGGGLDRKEKLLALESK